MPNKKDIAKKMSPWNKKSDNYMAGPADYLRNKAKQKGKGSHDDILKRHPALKNKYGSNYPTGYTPE